MLSSVSQSDVGPGEGRGGGNFEVDTHTYTYFGARAADRKSGVGDARVAA